MKRFVRRGFSSTPLWLAIGAANILLGVSIALRANGSRDAGWLWVWTRAWLDGTNPYSWPIPADYPPWALVALSPLGMLSPAVVPAVWAAADVALAMGVAALGVSVMRPQGVPLRLSIGWFVSWAAVRYGLGNGQFALLTMACGLAAVSAARRGSKWSGVLLAAASIKPHLGIAFLAWAVAARKWRSICGAAAAIGAATVAFSIRLRESPLSIAGQYLRQVASEFAGSQALRGDVEIRPLFDVLIPDARAAALVNAVLIGAALAAVWWTLRHQTPDERDRRALPLFCAWTLVSVFHNAYDLVLLWPVWLVVRDLQGDDEAGSLVLLLLVQLALVAGIPGLWWKFRGWIPQVVFHFDRVFVAALLVYLVAVMSRRPALGKIRGRQVIQTAAGHATKVMLP